MLVTSALANKILVELNSDKEIYLQRERDSSFYTVSQGEEVEIPSFDFNECCRAIDEIDSKVGIIKHAINLANINAKIDVLGETYSVDQLLVKMAQLSKRMNYFNLLRKALPKKRLDSRCYGSSSSSTKVVEYQYINYDVQDAQREYKECQKKVTALQLALDTYNHTVQFDIDIDYDFEMEDEEE